MTASIVPLIKYELRSSATPSELAAILREHVQPPPIITRWRGHKPFNGSVNETGFRILRVGPRRNFFRPTLFGVFLPDDQGTLIRITIRYGPEFFGAIAIFFLILVYLGWREMALPFLLAIVRGGNHGLLEYLSPPQHFFLLIPLAFLLLIAIFIWLFFPSEAQAAKDEFAEIIAQSDVAPSSPSHKP